MNEFLTTKQAQYLLEKWKSEADAEFLKKNPDGSIDRDGANMNLVMICDAMDNQIGQTQASDVYNALIFRDRDESNTMFMQSVVFSNGNVRGDYVTSRRNAAGTILNNGFYQHIYSDGSFGLTFTSTAAKDAWLEGLGIGNSVSVSNFSTSASNNTDTTLGNTGSLAAGTYMLHCHASFPSSTTGRRRLWLATSTSGGNIDRYCTQIVAPANGAATEVDFTYMTTITAATTFYLRCYQNSGSSQTVTAGIQRLKLH